jgi:hypothetical protein
MKLIPTAEERKAKAERYRKLAVRQFALDTPTTDVGPATLAKKIQQFSAGTQIPLFADIAQQKLDLCVNIAEQLCEEGIGDTRLAGALLQLAEFQDSAEGDSANPAIIPLSPEQLKAILADDGIC